MQTLHGQVAVISGGQGDIGRATALELARRGAKVSVADLRAGDLPSCLFVQGDVSDRDFVKEWLDRTETELGTPTLVVVNAAVVTLASALDTEPDEWDRQLRVNLTGGFHLAQLAARRMIDRGIPGRIVFIGSWVADRADPSITAYCASKAGLRMLMKCLAKELAPHGILVNEVAPGFVDAGVSAQVFREQPGRREESLRRVPIHRLITADEVAQQVAYLCEPENRHMTGSVLLMDGGNSL